MKSVLIYPPETLRRRPPANLAPEDAPLFAAETTRDTPPVHLLTVPKATWFISGAVRSDLRFVPGSVRSTKLLAEYNWKFNLKTWWNLKRIRGKEAGYLSIIDDWSGGYFHWLADALPRLLAARAAGVPPDVPILLPTSFEKLSYVKGTFAALGARTEYVPAERYFYARELLLPTHVATTGNFRTEVTQNLRALLLDSLTKKPAPFTVGEKIYVSRQRAARRKVANEMAVAALLREYGFETVCFEDYDWPTQAAIAARARFWVGLHGAGLTNLLFAPPDARVLELRFQRDAHNNCFYALANTLGLPYFYQTCEPLPDPADRLGSALTNLSVLKQNLRLLLD